MWRLQKIQATNLCAFRNLQYELLQGQTTLVFGNNMDDDSQNSNGSGKSALIEAIAIALTGETLRRVNMTEIINDAFDEATLTAVLDNPEENASLIVNRSIPRKGVQSITVMHNGEEVKQANITDYNKFILDTIGVSKEDLFATYILTAKKYRSFLSSSDREKKELINKFSNGVMVDESIEALHADMEPIQTELQETEKKVAECNGRVAALEEEIQKAVNESADRQANRQARIESWKQEIVNKRAEIRQVSQDMLSIRENLNILDDLDAKMQDLEERNLDLKSSYQSVRTEFQEHKLPLVSDYANRLSDLEQSRNEYQKRIQALQKDLRVTETKFSEVTREFDEASQSYSSNVSKLGARSNEVNSLLSALAQEVRSMQANIESLNSQKTSVYSKITRLEQQLAGVITCPKCKHQFMLTEDIDVAQLNQDLKNHKHTLRSLSDQITQAETDYQQCVVKGKQAREQQNQIEDDKMQLKRDLQSVESKLEDIKHNRMRAQRNMQNLQEGLDSTLKSLDNLRREMFDEVFDNIDNTVKRLNSDIDKNSLQISNLEGAIKSYEESIQEMESVSETDVVESFKVSKEKYENELVKAIQYKEQVERNLNDLKFQESTFVDFKTHLANTKIDAISQITNDFLTTIGSDIRVSLSGYTKLKSGKIRDKISVSLLRDGVDCGSFEKFSKGEQTRVELACILALHQLTNVNCEEGKGLNLLVFDEILDATDEQGLTNIFKAINDTQITSLVVSHGNIAENYPNRLIINKQNGVSFINESE